MKGLLDHLCCYVQLISIVVELHEVIDSLEVFIYWQERIKQIVNSLIVVFKVRSHNLTVSI